MATSKSLLVKKSHLLQGSSFNDRPLHPKCLRKLCSYFLPAAVRLVNQHCSHQTSQVQYNSLCVKHLLVLYIRMLYTCYNQYTILLKICHTFAASMCKFPPSYIFIMCNILKTSLQSHFPVPAHFNCLFYKSLFFVLLSVFSFCHCQIFQIEHLSQKAQTRRCFWPSDSATNRATAGYSQLDKQQGKSLLSVAAHVTARQCYCIHSYLPMWS